MNSSNFRFVLDLHKTQSQVSIPVTRGDTARVWYISLSDGGQPYIIEYGCYVLLQIMRPTGTSITEPCVIENNTTIKYDFSQSDAAKLSASVEGIHECGILIYGADDEVIASSRFSMVVTDRAVSFNDINLSDEDRTAIDAMLASMAEIELKEIGRDNKEAERQNNEHARGLAEEGREAASAEAVQRANTATQRANTIAATLENKLANGEFNGADGGDFSTAGLTVDCEIDPSTYVMTVAIKDATGNVLSSDTVDLPLEEMIVSGRADGENITLTLKNGQTIQFSVSDIVSGLVSQESYDADISRIESALGSYITDVDALIGGDS